MFFRDKLRLRQHVLMFFRVRFPSRKNIEKTTMFFRDKLRLRQNVLMFFRDRHRRVFRHEKTSKNNGVFSWQAETRAQRFDVFS